MADEEPEVEEDSGCKIEREQKQRKGNRKRLKVKNKQLILIEGKCEEEVQS